MRIHHLDCGTLCPLAQRLANGHGSLFRRGSMVCHCLLIETEAGLVLVDTGLGLVDVQHGMPGLFNVVAGPRLTPEGTALGQVEALGFEAADVRHIVVTHLDLDHAGGLPDFPRATVHLHAREHAAAQARRGKDKYRYLPRHWAHGPRWETYDAADGEPWFGFEAVRDLAGLPPEILLVPLPGHSKGHTGVAVQTDDGWLLHGGDAWFNQGDLVAPRTTPAGLKLFQWLAADDNALRRVTLGRLQELAFAGPPGLRLMCAHDPQDLAELAGADGG